MFGFGSLRTISSGTHKHSGQDVLKTERKPDSVVSGYDVSRHVWRLITEVALFKLRVGSPNNAILKTTHAVNVLARLFY